MACWVTVTLSIMNVKREAYLRAKSMSISAADGAQHLT